MFLALALAYRRLLAGWALAGGDLQMYFFPYWAEAARALQAGRLPLWNPYLFAGAPMLANSQAGVFYPLNWPFWLLAGTDLVGVAAALHASVLLHVALATLTAYALARRLGLARTGAALAALLYAGGGFLGVHVEHLNQLQALAWFPLALLPARARMRRGGVAAGGFWALVRQTSALNVAAFALMLLAGHTQTAFIAAVGVVVFRATQIRDHVTTYPRGNVRAASRFLLSLSPFVLAGVIAAVQLAPTLELAGLSVRAGGLPWREAVSFSFVPWQAHRVLLPAYLFAPALPEGEAYLGLVGLALAGWAAVRAIRSRERAQVAALVLAGVGLFLALGAYNPLYLLAARLGLPGVAQFRAPARYLALYALGGALLAGFGAEAGLRLLGEHARRWPWLPVAARGLLLVTVAAELALSAEALPHAHATSPRTYSDLRPATAHLVAAARESEVPGRFLSISKMLFEPGDKAEIESIYGEVLDADALWAYLVAAKAREVLAPNLPLAFAVPAADGYDGGLLPLRHYAAFSTLLLPEGTLDGRLRENLEAIPDARWLALLDVRFLITDKVGDLWSEGVFYDRQFQPELAPGAALTLAWLPGNFPAEGLRLLCEGASAGEVEMAFADGRALQLPLPACAGEIPIEVTWDFTAVPERLTLRAGGSPLGLTGVTLINGAGADAQGDADFSFYPLTLSDCFRLVHSGDVKLYETVAPSARAMLVHGFTCLQDSSAVLAELRAPGFDPEAIALLEDCPAALAELMVPATRELPPGASESVEVLAYSAERVALAVRATAPGLLVLKDAWFPEWNIAVEPLDELEAPAVFEGAALKAQVLFRAAPIPAGEWRVTFVYRSTRLALGAVLSGLGIMVWGVYALWRRRAHAQETREEESHLESCI